MGSGGTPSTGPRKPIANTAALALLVSLALAPSLAASGCRPSRRLPPVIRSERDAAQAERERLAALKPALSRRPGVEPIAVVRRAGLTIEVRAWFGPGWDIERGALETTRAMGSAAHPLPKGHVRLSIQLVARNTTDATVPVGWEHPFAYVRDSDGKDLKALSGRVETQRGTGPSAQGIEPGGGVLLSQSFAVKPREHSLKLSWLIRRGPRPDILRLRIDPSALRRLGT